MRMNCALVLLIVFGLSVVRTEEDLDNSRTRTSGVYVDSGDSFKQYGRAGPFWDKLTGGRSENERRSFNSDTDINRHDDQDDHQKQSLKEFLETYAKKHNKKPVLYDEHSTQSLDKLIQEDSGPNKNTKDKSMSNWALMDLQKHNHPFDDRKGWVSLEPLPWSVSKISKWQSKYKPSSERPWDEHGPISSQRPYTHNDDIDLDLEFNRPVSITPPSPYVYHRPTDSSDRYDTNNYYDQDRDRPRPTPLSNIRPRPTAYFGNKVHVQAQFPTNSYSSSTGRPSYTYHNKKDCNRPNHPYDEIITDGGPSNFPQQNAYDSLRRRGTEMEIHSENHPFNGEGEWVLLSTTKGYKPQKSRQRSLELVSSSEPTQVLRASRGVRLTVLPPLKGSKVNMTTSHGGLLQVESTFESVEQAKQKFDKKQNQIKIKTKRKRIKAIKKNADKRVQNNASQNVGNGPQYADPGAVMAAVGAGIIPATMAMMVPIVMNGG